MVILYGGSFNPPTIGHYEIIKKLQAHFNDALIVLMPVGNLYPKSELVGGKDRFEMLELLVNDLDNVVVSDFEIKRPYIGTIRALEFLAHKYETEAILAIGADNLEGLPNWIEGRKLLKTYKIVVLNRREEKLKEQIDNLVNNYQAQITTIDFDYNISASEIRKDINKNKKYLLPEVFAYIQKHSLYKGE